MKQETTLDVLDRFTANEDETEFLGSSLERSRTVGDKDYYFFENGSVLVRERQSPYQTIYHYLTREGRQARKHFQDAVGEIVGDSSKLRGTEVLGNGHFSHVRRLKVNGQEYALKTTEMLNFHRRETITPQGFSDDESIVFVGMRVVDTVEILAHIKESGYLAPEFYGFSLKRMVGGGQIQEFQLMEVLPYASLLQIADKLKEEYVANRTVDYSLVPSGEMIEAMVQDHFGGSFPDFFNALSDAYGEFVAEIVDKTRIVDEEQQIEYEISDVEIDNIYLAGYDAESNKFQFLVADPMKVGRLSHSQ